MLQQWNTSPLSDLLPERDRKHRKTPIPWQSMDYQALAIIGAFAFGYSLVGARLERFPINGAVIYVFAGFLCSSLGLIEINIGQEGLRMLAELTLALFLFTDSAKTNLGTLKRIKSIATRLLFLGLPFTIASGFLAGYLLFDELDAFQLALLATILAPTDAALGKAVVANTAVPDSIRKSISVESGLNDGLCVPLLLFFLALATDEQDALGAAQLVLELPIRSIGIGLAVGIVGGSMGSQLLRLSSLRRWLSGTWVQLPVISLTLMCFAAAQWFGGSGFVACFVAGILFGSLSKAHKAEYLQAAEGTGDFMALVTWFVSGAAAIALTWDYLSWQVFAYALLSLTLVRMLPVFLCVAGLGLRTDSKAFIGWFGPRGLASIVFAVMVRSENLPGNDLLLAIATWTILISVVLHGMTANPLSSIYGTRVNERGGKL